MPPNSRYSVYATDSWEEVEDLQLNKNFLEKFSTCDIKNDFDSELKKKIWTLCLSKNIGRVIFGISGISYLNYSKEEQREYQRLYFT